MKLSKKILEKILKDSSFSSKMATLLGIKQVSVEKLAKRNSAKLTQYLLVKFYMQNGFKEKEIFEK